MNPQELEPEAEALLLDLYPSLANEWKGATDEQIDRIEIIAKRPLPRFYKWFLLRMGQSTGPIAWRGMVWSASAILRCYEEPSFKDSLSDPRFLLIGFETSQLEPLHAFYDFEHPSDGDCRLVYRYIDDEPNEVTRNASDSFRESFVGGEIRKVAINSRPVRCEGMISWKSGKSMQRLGVTMASLGFSQPISVTGENYGMYLRGDAAMAVESPLDSKGEYSFFDLGGAKEKDLREILGAIELELDAQTTVDSWNP